MGFRLYQKLTFRFIQVGFYLGNNLTFAAYIKHMQLRFTIVILITLSLLIGHSAYSQSVFKLHGTVKDAGTGFGLRNVSVRMAPLNRTVQTDNKGHFSLEYTGQFDGQLTIELEGYLPLVYTIKAGDVNAPMPLLFEIERDPSSNVRSNTAGTIPTITIDDDGGSDGNQEISSLLSASRDPFISAANFNFGAFRFRMRGYDAEYNSILLNGIAMNDPESGFLVFGEWGGLNDVLRNTDTHFGLESTSFGFGNIGNNTLIDLRASQQRKTMRASYAISNRSYRNRVMATYNTGKLENGWSFSASGSYRWAEAGYIKGTHYRGLSYFLGAEKQLNTNHAIGLTVLGAPTERGRSAGAVQEAYDLVGDNYYNPNWGYQNGEVRNSRISRLNKPMAILRHDWAVSKGVKMTNVLSYQSGVESYKRLDWYNARDPRPDYYKYLPSAGLDDHSAQLLHNAWTRDDKWRQIDWDYMYETNRIKNETITNVNGIPGNTVSGRRSYYILEDSRSDNDIINWNTMLEALINERITLQGGFNYQFYNANYYRLVDDLLGGDFYVDIDKFAERDLAGNFEAAQPDLARPNRVVREGDRFGHDYDMNSRNGGAWIQSVITLPKVDFFAAVSGGLSTFWRTGNVQNGRFPSSSLGDSEKFSFPEYGIKAGVTYKINGQNYIILNGSHMSQAPLVNNSFISPRTRNNANATLVNELIQSVEGGYVMRSPHVKLKATGFLTTIENKINRSAFFNDVDGTFVNFNMEGIGLRNIGVELGAEVRLLTGLKLLGMASIGEYVYTSRPDVIISNDNDTEVKKLAVYQKGYYVENTPQQAYTVGLNYNSPHFWFANINANYARKAYLDMNPYRRTSDVADPELVQPGSATWYRIINQEELPAMFTIDFFGGKSFKLRNTFINLTVGVNNLLNNTGILTGGFEQSRVRYDQLADEGTDAIDISKFPPKYFYAYGTNYFISLGVRI